MSKNEKKVNEKNNNSISWLYLFLLVVCAIIAGIFGQTISRTYLLKDVYSPLSNYNEVDLGNLTASRPGLVIRDPKMVVVNQDVKFSETVSDVKNSLVGVFEKIVLPEKDNKVISAEGLKETNDYSSYYNLEKPLLVGYVVTADGWLVAAAPSDFSFSAQELVVIDNNRKLYEISELSLSNNDGLIFLRLAEAENLMVRKNMAKSDFFLGQSFLAIKDLSSVEPLNSTTLSEREELLSSEDVNINLNFSSEAKDLKNSFIFNLAGDLAAIVNFRSEIIPAFSYNYFFRNLLEENPSTRPYFGVNYLNLSEVKIAGLSPDINKGALLYSDGKKLAVLKDSPASKAGLQEHDIITWVNNKEINKDNDLAEVISYFKPGDSLQISYLRNGLESSLSLVLEESPLETEKSDVIFKK